MYRKRINETADEIRAMYSSKIMIIFFFRYHTFTCIITYYQSLVRCEFAFHTRQNAFTSRHTIYVYIARNVLIHAKRNLAFSPSICSDFLYLYKWHNKRKPTANLDLRDNCTINKHLHNSLKC